MSVIAAQISPRTRASGNASRFGDYHATESVNISPVRFHYFLTLTIRLSPECTIPLQMFLAPHEAMLRL
jgi:hypothetical protein